MKVYDKHIRKLVIKNICGRKEFLHEKSTVVVHELDVCSGIARVDIAVINGKMHGFEIKSEQDTLDRLIDQAELYNRVFDTMTLVVSEKHMEKSLECIPEWWGVYTAVKTKRSVKLKRFRQCRKNKSVDGLSVTELLWKDELLELLKLAGITKGVKSKTRDQLRKLVINELDDQSVIRYTKDKLKSRTTWRAVPVQEICDDLHRL